jgi:hypothetical protein
MPLTEIDLRKADPCDVRETIEELSKLRVVSVVGMSETRYANTSRLFVFAGLDLHDRSCRLYRELCKVGTKPEERC